MKKALLLVYLSTHFVEQFRVAQMLRRSERYEPVLYFDRPYAGIDQDIARCHAENILCLDASGSPLPPPSPAAPSPSSEPPAAPPAPISRKQRLVQFAERLGPLRPIFHLFYYWLWTVRFASQVRRLIDQQQPDILILPEDNVGYTTALWIRLGHERGIPSVIVPYAIVSTLDPAEGLRHSPTYSLDRWENRLAGVLYPRWVYEHQGQRMVRLPASRLLVMEWLGLAPPRPWVMNSGYADAIAVESGFMRDHYLREGLPEDRFVMTGALYDDTLAEALRHADERRAALYAELGLPPDRPLLLCSLPPNQLTGEGRPTCDFQTYERLLDFWAETLLAVKNYHIALNLHPRIRREEVQHLESRGLKIAPHSTAALVPLCDIYVASVTSAIRMAIACGIPVINYDVYRYGYHDYAGAGGVLTLEEQQEFVEAVQRLTEDPAFYAEIKARQDQSMAYWGQLDGQAGARMLQLFDRLIAEAKAAHG